MATKATPVAAGAAMAIHKNADEFRFGASGHKELREIDARIQSLMISADLEGTDISYVLDHNGRREYAQIDPSKRPQGLALFVRKLSRAAKKNHRKDGNKDVLPTDTRLVIAFEEREKFIRDKVGQNMASMVGSGGAVLKPSEPMSEADCGAMAVVAASEQAQKIEQLQQRIDAAREVATGSLSEEIKQLRIAVKGHAVNIPRYERERKAAQGEFEGARSEYAAAQQAFKKEEFDFEEQAAELTGLTQKVSDLGFKRFDAKTALDEARAKVKEERKNLFRSAGALFQKGFKKGAKSLAERALDDAQVAYNAIDAEYGKAKASLEAKNQKARSFDRAQQGKKAKLDAAEKKFNAAKEKLGAAEQSLTKSQTNLEAAQQRLKALEAQLKKAQDELKQLPKEQAEAQVVIDHLRARAVEAVGSLVGNFVNEADKGTEPTKPLQKAQQMWRENVVAITQIWDKDHPIRKAYAELLAMDNPDQMPALYDSLLAIDTSKLPPDEQRLFNTLLRLTSILLDNSEVSQKVDTARGKRLANYKAFINAMIASLNHKDFSGKYMTVEAKGESRSLEDVQGDIDRLLDEAKKNSGLDSADIRVLQGYALAAMNKASINAQETPTAAVAQGVRTPQEEFDLFKLMVETSVKSAFLRAVKDSSIDLDDIAEQAVVEIKDDAGLSDEGAQLLLGHADLVLKQAQSDFAQDELESEDTGSADYILKQRLEDLL